MKYRVEKSTQIQTSVEKVRSLVSDFHSWKSWSPWTVIEPQSNQKIQGQSDKAGHSMEWDGEVIGSGRITLKSSDSHGLHYDLEFFGPWKSFAQTRFTFEESHGGCKVTWIMDSKMPFFLFFMVKMMKNWIGMDYERGLRMLKEVAEKGQVNCKTENSGMVDYHGFSYVGIKRTVPFDEMPTTMKQDFEEIVKDVVVEKEKSAKHWICLYPKFNMKNMMVTYIAAVSDENLKDTQLGAKYISGKVDNSKMIEIKHDGPYDFLGNAWSMGMMFVRAKKYKQRGFPFEQYWNSPLEVAPEELRTSLYFPIKNP